MQYKKVRGHRDTTFLPWQPSTWPSATKGWDRRIEESFKRILTETIILEIDNVIVDAQRCNGSLEYRGHVVALALMCGLDAVSSYGYRQQHMREFVAHHFPAEYRRHADKLYRMYRNSLAHSWNLFEAALYPGNESITFRGGALAFGLINFFEAFKYGIENFLDKMKDDVILQKRTIGRYEQLRKTARPWLSPPGAPVLTFVVESASITGARLTHSAGLVGGSRGGVGQA